VLAPRAAAVDVAPGELATAARLSARLRPAEVVESVRQLIARSPAPGRRELTLELEPPALGRVRLRVIQTGTQVRVELLVEHSSAARALSRELADLSSSVSRMGLHLEDTAVRVAGSVARNQTPAADTPGTPAGPDSEHGGRSTGHDASSDHAGPRRGGADHGHHADHRKAPGSEAPEVVTRRGAAGVPEFGHRIDLKV
jgi:hypothetical protein